MKKTLSSILYFALMCCLLTYCSKKETIPTKPNCYLSSYSNGDLTETLTYTNNKLNTLSDVYASNSSNNISATYTYDQKGNVMTVNYSNGNIGSFLYTNSNQLLQYTEPNVIQHKYTYNAYGQLTLWQMYSYDNTSSSYLLSSYRVYQYISTTNKNWSTVQKFNASDKLIWTWDFQYDSKNNPWNLVGGSPIPNPTNNVTQQITTYPGLSPTTTNISYTYTTSGYPLTAFNTTGSTITYTYSNCK